MMKGIEMVLPSQTSSEYDHRQRENIVINIEKI